MIYLEFDLMMNEISLLIRNSEYKARKLVPY
jgi:hypothetical protein